MVTIKVEVAPQYAARDVGDTLGGYRIHTTVPGGVQTLVDLPDLETWTDTKIALLAQRWQQQGLIVDDGNGLWRYEHVDYAPAVMPPPTPTEALVVRALYSVGDTFTSMGLTPEIRARGQNGQARVGIGDTWVDRSHSWLAQTPMTPWGAGRDTQVHGTHVTTTASGSEGIATAAHLYLANCLPGGNGSEATVAQGVRWLADQGCEVVNLSLGGSPSSVIDEAVQYARARGAWVCVAAGNGGGAAIGSPARAATVIVMACDRARRPASFTDGRGWPQSNRIYAPGVDIVAGFPDQQQGVSSGTSMATPHITGACAILRGAGLTEAAMLAYLRAAAHQLVVT